MVHRLLKGNADPTFVNEKNQSAYSFAVESKRKVVALTIAEACILYKMHEFHDDAHESIIANIKNGKYIMSFLFLLVSIRFRKFMISFRRKNI